MLPEGSRSSIKRFSAIPSIVSDVEKYFGPFDPEGASPLRIS
jgi:hypothetical protein